MCHYMWLTEQKPAYFAPPILIIQWVIIKDIVTSIFAEMIEWNLPDQCCGFIGVFTLWKVMDIGSKLIHVVCVYTKCALITIHIKFAFSQSTSIGDLKPIWRWIAPSQKLMQVLYTCISLHNNYHAPHKIFLQSVPYSPNILRV